MSAVDRFTGRAAAYERARPDYPAEALDAMLEDLGEPSRLIAADVGAGTGISTRALAARGPLVHALEPNDEMRSAGAAVPDDRIRWSAAKAEGTEIDPGAVDLVLCAQSFHWFDRDRALDELVRILRPGGRLALLWNDRDDRDLLTAGYNRILDAIATHRPGARPAMASPLDGRPDLRNVRRLQFDNGQRLDREGFLGRAQSASYFPAAGKQRDQALADLSSLHARHADARGVATMCYVTELWLAETAM